MNELIELLRDHENMEARAKFLAFPADKQKEAISFVLNNLHAEEAIDALFGIAFVYLGHEEKEKCPTCNGEGVIWTCPPECAKEHCTPCGR